MTGTPEGIAPIKPGDFLEAKLSYEGETLATISDRIVKEDSPFQF